MPPETWRVTAWGMAGGEFVYEVEAGTRSEALEEAYARHGRRYKAGEVREYLSPRASAVRIGGSETAGA